MATPPPKSASVEPEWATELYSLMVGFSPEKAALILNNLMIHKPIVVEICTFLVACITIRRNEIVNALGKLSDGAKAYIRDNYRLSNGDINFSGLNLSGWIVLSTNGPALDRFKQAVVYKTGATSLKLATFINSSERYKTVATRRRDAVNAESYAKAVASVKW